MPSDETKLNTVEERDKRPHPDTSRTRLLAAAPLLAASLALLLASLSMGCQLVQETRQPDDPPATVQPGMTPEDVRARLGAPLDTIHADGRLRWMIYGTEFEEVYIYVQHGMVEAIPPALDRDGEPKGGLWAKRRVEADAIVLQGGKSRYE